MTVENFREPELPFPVGGFIERAALTDLAVQSRSWEETLEALQKAIKGNSFIQPRSNHTLRFNFPGRIDRRFVS